MVGAIVRDSLIIVVIWQSVKFARTFGKIIYTINICKPVLARRMPVPRETR